GPATAFLRKRSTIGADARGPSATTRRRGRQGTGASGNAGRIAASRRTEITAAIAPALAAQNRPGADADRDRRLSRTGGGAGGGGGPPSRTRARGRAHHRDLARESLHRLRAEIGTNRKTVQGVKDYHVEMRKRIEGYLAADEHARRTLSVRLQGVQPAFFEHTAWDLALATQSLTYIESDLAFAL